MVTVVKVLWVVRVVIMMVMMVVVLVVVGLMMWVWVRVGRCYPRLRVVWVMWVGVGGRVVWGWVVVWGVLVLEVVIRAPIMEVWRRGGVHGPMRHVIL